MKANKNPIGIPPIEGPSLGTSFKRSQIASLIATVVDFGALVLLTELAHLWYVASTACGAFLGAITNFWLGRHWSFEAHEEDLHGQAFKYAIVSGGSLLLNSGGVFVLTDYGKLPYPVSKAIAALLIGFVWNFPLQRAFVFKREKR